MSANKLLDTETLFDELITRIAPPGVTPIQWLHADSFDQMPFVSWQVVNNGQRDHGLWDVMLILEVVADSAEMFNICNELYKGIHGWGIYPAGFLENVGHIDSINDGNAFDKSSQVLIQGKYLAQASASFTLTARVN